MYMYMQRRLTSLSSVTDPEHDVTDPEHDAVLDVEQDLLSLAVVSDERVQRVGVRHPAQQAGVRRQRDHRVARDPDVTTPRDAALVSS